MSRKKVVVLGSNFGGLTAALAVNHELRGDVDVTVVSPSEQFLFNPSLIWVPFGKRVPADITFDVRQPSKSMASTSYPKLQPRSTRSRKRWKHRGPNTGTTISS